MKNTIINVISQFLFLMYLISASFEINAESIEKRLVEKTDDILAEYLKNNWFSGNVVVKQGDQVLYNRSFGYADIPEKIEITPETKIRIGSINKHYTAVLILQKIQSGDLSLNDSLSKFSLGFPEEVAKKITIRYLLQHTSGFADIFNDEYIKTYRSLLDINAKLPLLINTPLLSEPGSKYHYSNYGYIVLGAILEKIEQKTFRQILEKNILERIGSKNTLYALTDSVEGKARSYRYNQDGSKIDKTDILENVTPDGGMYSTSEDIALFYSNLFYSNVLLNDEFKAVMSNDYRESSRPWSEIVSKDKSRWSAYGGAPGVSAAAEILIKDKLIVIVLANTDGLVAEKISQRIVKAYDKLKKN